MLLVKCIHLLIEKNLPVLMLTRHTVDKISSLLQLMIQSDGKTYHYQTYLIKRILLKSHVALVFLYLRYLT